MSKGPFSAIFFLAIHSCSSGVDSIVMIVFPGNTPTSDADKNWFSESPSVNHCFKTPGLCVRETVCQTLTQNCTLSGFKNLSSLSLSLHFSLSLRQIPELVPVVVTVISIFCVLCFAFCSLFQEIKVRSSTEQKSAYILLDPLEMLCGQSKREKKEKEKRTLSHSVQRAA